jgi:glycerophosphoryl diester phosphodiesterase
MLTWSSPGALLLLATLLASAGCGGGCSAQPRRAAVPLSRPLIFAHRGGGGEAPESTLAAMQAAVARDPAVVIELDVRRTADGQLVIIHDATVDRTTNGQGPVAALPYRQLAALDAGYCAAPGLGRGTAPARLCRDPAAAGRFPLRGQGHHIPLLTDVLQVLPATTVLGIEVKEPGFEQQVVEVLRAHGRPPRLFIGSAQDEVAVRLQRLLPEAWHYFPRGAATRLAASAKLTDGAMARPAYDLLVIPRSAYGMRLDTKGMLKTAHQLGLLVAYFTINDEAEIEALLRAGADGIVTDYPTRARRVLDRLGLRPSVTPPLDITKPAH